MDNQSIQASVRDESQQTDSGCLFAFGYGGLLPQSRTRFSEILRLDLPKRLLDTTSTMNMNLWQIFVEKVTFHFRFLETDFACVRTLTKQPNAVYESDKVQVQVYYDSEGRHELDLGVRRLPDDPRKALSLGIGMLMRLRGDADGYISPFPSTPEDLEYEVKRLAELLRSHGAAVLSGDLRDFDRAERVELELAEKFGPPKQPQ
jgi:hypothetical protein